MDPAEKTERFRDSKRVAGHMGFLSHLNVSSLHHKLKLLQTKHSVPSWSSESPSFPQSPSSQWVKRNILRLSSQKGVGDPLNPLIPSAPTSSDSLVCISQMDIFNSFNFLYFHCQPSPVSHVTNPAITSQLNYCKQFFWPASNSFFIY